MDEESKKRIVEIYAISKQAGNDLIASLDCLDRLREKKETMPKDISELVDKLAEVLPDAVVKHFSMYQVVAGSGALDEQIEHYIVNPVRREDGTIEEYQKEKVKDSIRKSGVKNGEAERIARAVTSELEKKFGLGQTVVYSRFIRHVIYKTLLEKKHVEEASRYKALSMIENDEEMEAYSHGKRKRPVRGAVTDRIKRLLHINPGYKPS
jgi:transcriptional regulator NrdR family protein